MLSDTNAHPHAAHFEPQRRRLIGLAYRMLGSLADAQDTVQDAFLRFQAVELSHVGDPPSYLGKTVARLCLDRLKSARATREQYVGTWLPEPLLEDSAPLPEATMALADDLSFALMLTLERLSPPERTAFLLHDVFGMDFDAIGSVLERAPSSCRKLAQRARTQVQEDRPRFAADPEQETRLSEAFLVASSSGDVEALARLLAHDAVMYSDGGGKRKAALNPIYGSDRIARFFAGVLRKANHQVPQAVTLRRVNQQAGCLLQYENGDLVVAAIETRDGLVTRIYVVSNPDKLQHLRS
jgi:RNA polymerase sigma-70 factor (ECF subfamily)